MEVSSQAYKLKRVFGLTFDVGVFLNIGQDHISLVEHPTFEDYFFCKRELIRHSRQLVLNADTDYHGLLTEEARLAGARTLTVSREDGDLILTQEGEGFTLRYHGQEVAGSADQPMRLRLAGAFNQDNAAAAVAVALSLGSPAGSPQLRALEQVQVSGRMERLVSADGVVGYVDFAHNHLSTSSLLDEVERVYGRENPRIILVSGSTGGKAVNRRQGIVTAANGRVDSFIFTEDDQDRENATQIARQMRGYVTDTEASTQIVMPRAKAIEAAVAQAREYPGRRNVILVIGKGDEVYNVVNGVKQPYEGAAVDSKALADSLLQAGTTGKDATARTVPLELSEVAAAHAESEAELGVAQVVGEYATAYYYDPVRTQNLVTGTAKINGTLVRPGETFSLAQVLGPIDAEHGFTSSGVLSGGVHSNAMGGGLSQVTTTTFNAAFEAGMDDVEHHPHSVWFTRYPAGREATLWTGHLDLKWKNSTPYAALVQAWAADGQVHVRLWSTPYYTVSITSSDKTNIRPVQVVHSTAASCVPYGGGQVGFDITVTRSRRAPEGASPADDVLSTSYQADNVLVCPSPEPAEPAEAAGEDGGGGE